MKNKDTFPPITEISETLNSSFWKKTVFFLGIPQFIVILLIEKMDLFMLLWIQNFFPYEWKFIEGLTSAPSWINLPQDIKKYSTEPAQRLVEKLPVYP